MNPSVFIVDESELLSLCDSIFPLINKQRIVLLKGQMGVGKTRFVRALGEYLGFEDEAGSPTFSIINEYHIPDNNWNVRRIFHVDLYRLNTLQEAMDIGIMEYLDSSEICIIEWPELISELTKKLDTLNIQIEVLENQQRKFTLTL